MGGKPPSMLVMDQMEDNVMLVFMCDHDEVPMGRGDVLTIVIMITFSDYCGRGSYSCGT